MSREVSFFVPGIPVPQGSKNAFVNKHTQRAVVVDQNAATLKPWREAITAAALEVMVQPDVGSFKRPTPVTVCLSFYFPRPASQTKAQKRIRSVAVRPDIDKLARSVLDALTNARVFEDDAQVSNLHAIKEYTAATTGLLVRVEADLEWTPEPPPGGAVALDLETAS